MPINGISFHLEERVQRWKCVVQRQIADEVNVSHKHHLCLSIIALIVKAGMSKIISNVGPFFPQLIKEFIVNFPSKFNNPSSPDYQTMHIRDSMFKISLAIINDFLGNTVVSDFQSSHPSNDELTYVLFGVLNMSYSIKLALQTSFSSSHASSVFVALRTFLYQICNDESVDASLFMYNQLLRHVGTFGVKILIPLLRFFSSLLIHLNVDILAANDTLGFDSKTLSLSYRLFLDSHDLDLEHDMRPSRNPQAFDTDDIDVSSEVFFIPRDLASRIINTLTAES
ncbi:uncharacterized protein LOC103499141 [Cucumis melo]|uniref:Uncharacterized protein LOC103499141 n=1 Tax=Cucumis melo TaxID=3656 RepID=A0A1S3CCK0_CUCME|nr:uncharacterized protein LOC103499141 [Cucumis melo]